jgi:hypothetical protein
MHEHIFAAVLRLNKTKSLTWIEPFHCAACHILSPLVAPTFDIPGRGVLALLNLPIQRNCHNLRRGPSARGLRATLNRATLKFLPAGGRYDGI